MVPPLGELGSRQADRGALQHRGIGPDDEAYFAIPGSHLGAVEEHLTVMVRANQELEKFHRGRAAATPTT